MIIASPDATHAELALACLKAGKAVLCEKPLGLLRSGRASRGAGGSRLGRRLIQVGYMRRFDPGYQAMKRIKEDGGVGAIALLHNVHRNASAPEWFTGAHGGDQCIRARDRHQPMADRVGDGFGASRGGGRAATR